MNFKEESTRIRRQADPQLSSTSNSTQTTILLVLILFVRMRVACVLIWAPPVCFFQLDVTVRVVHALIGLSL